MAALSFTTDLTAADWLVTSGTPDEQLIDFGPAGFAAYARLRFIPDPVRPGQDEADVDLPADHPADLARVRRALGVLAGFTTTPDDGWFCLWEGYSDVPLPPTVQRGPLLTLPHRRFALLHGPLAAVDGWERLGWYGGPIAPPALVWPGDHAWCLAADVDPHWAGIGASADAVAALIDDPELDVVVARPDEPQPLYY